MKIYQINVVCGYGSTGRIAVDLSKVAEKEGHECRIAYGRGDAPEGVDAIKIASKVEVYAHVLMTRIFDRHGLHSKRATKHLIRDIKDYNPDVIHLHNIHGYYLNYELLFAFLKEYKKPVVWTMHDCWAFTGHCSYYSEVNCDKWKESCGRCPQKKTYPTSIFMDASKGQFIRKKEAFTGIDNLIIVTPSKWLESEVKKSFLSKYETIVINNGIDLNVFKPTVSDFKERYKLQDKKILLGVANVWSKGKGLEDFLKIAAMLGEQWKVVIVGIDSKLAKKIPKEILAIPRTSSVKELAKIYTAADVYFNASVEETMGLTTVEAMACGTPAVVYNKTAVPEVVTTESGVVVKAGDLNAVKESVEAIANNAEWIEKCRRQASNYLPKSKYGQYIVLYQKMYE
ncbi:MAG: glycosyltransferase [Lachnospiraceae bacterium]|nr:glycosyltransferase [Lachnospiraceae bacterium]